MRQGFGYCNRRHLRFRIVLAGLRGIWTQFPQKNGESQTRLLIMAKRGKA